MKSPGGSIFPYYYKGGVVEVVNHLRNIDEHVVKLSFVGLSGINKWRLKGWLKKYGIKQRVSFFSDPEDAKTWLINER